MKKLLIFLMVLTVGLLGVSNQQVYASSSEIDWTCYSDEVVIGIVDILADTKSVTVGLPHGQPAIGVYEVENQGAAFSFKFKEDSITKATLFNDILDTQKIVYDNGYDDYVNEYIINFSAYDIPDGVDKLQVTIPVASCQDVEQQLDEDGTYSYTFDEIGLGLFSFAVYPDVELEGSTYTQNRYVSQYIEISQNTKIIDSYIPLTLALFGPEDKSIVRYYDSNYNEVLSVEIANNTAEDYYHDWYPYDIVGDIYNHVMNVAWSFYSFDDTNEIKYIRFEVYDYNSTYGMVSAVYYSSVSFYYIDGARIEVNFIIDGEIDLTKYAVEGSYIVYRSIPPTIEDKTFSHWVDPNGNEYLGTITSSMVNNDVVNIYAIYVDEIDSINPSVVDPTPDAGAFGVLLTEAGFNDPAERVIIFAIIVLLVSIVLLVKGVAVFNILVVVGIIVAFFVSLGLLPAFVSIIIILILIFLGYRYLMGGGVNE